MPERHPPAPEQGRALLALARASLESLFRGDGATVPSPPEPWLAERRAVFVTLTEGGALRGCVGAVEPLESLAAAVWSTARAAACRDPRFFPLRAEELPRVRIEISMLGAPEPLACRDEDEACELLRPGLDGVVLECGTDRGVFLPQVWESLPAPRRFLAELRRKAGLPPNAWPPGLRLSRFGVEKFVEPYR